MEQNTIHHWEKGERKEAFWVSDLLQPLQIQSETFPLLSSSESPSQSG